MLTWPDDDAPEEDGKVSGRVLAFPGKPRPHPHPATSAVVGWSHAYDLHLAVRYSHSSQSVPGDRPDEESLLHVLPGALLFDPRFYEAQAGRVDWPRTHYMREGWREGFDPHPLFCTSHYVERLGRPLQRDPLFDFLTRGRFECAEVHPLFCNASYLARRPDVARAGVHPLVHYIEYGWNEGVRGTFRWFDEQHYLQQTPGLENAGIIPISHYLTLGWREGKTPTPQFDPVLLNDVGAVRTRREPLTQFTLDLERGPLLRTSAEPGISVIVLNLNKPLLTLACLRTLSANTDLGDVEVIVVDNGSREPEFATLARHAAGARLIRLETNMGFGEANNIAVAAARGERIVFLNNDAFVTAGWLPALSRALDEEGVGAVGPLLLYPDGVVQEAGAFVSADGTAHQFGKGLSVDFEPLTHPADVHYVSAAAMMVRKADFQEVGGFDLCWDPAYYEDADLCLKLKLSGRRTVYTPAARVHHVEHATSSDTSLDLRLHDIVEINRLKFVSRWSGWLRDPSAPPRNLLPRRAADVTITPGRRRRAVLHTPFPLTPGGGERYLLTLASALSADHETALWSSLPYSDLRLATLGRDLGLDLSGVRLIAGADAARDAAGADLLIAMGNELLPPVAPSGGRNIHHCQFPFPMDAACLSRRWRHAQGWDCTIVNSAFTLEACLREAARLGLEMAPVHVLAPPVPLVRAGPRLGLGPRRILNVGRFFRDGHCKRQDRLVEAFGGLMSVLPDVPLQLDLVGGVGASPDDREYLRHVRRLARGLPVRFHVNVQPDALDDLYTGADLYWHATGLGEAVGMHPERFEHFGIAVVEAMSAGVTPLALDAAGPSEIITHGVDGLLYADETELIAFSARLLQPEACDEAAEMSRRARARAEAFSVEAFRAEFTRLLASLD